jgi:hypothetical protein
MGEIVQLRKKGGLHRILNSSNGAPIMPKEYLQDIKDRNKDGVLQGEYKGNTLPDTKHGIAPMWNRVKNQWSWASDASKLAELINKLKLRYPKGHKLEGDFIKSGDNPADRITYFQDDFFRHPAFYGKLYMENGRLSFDLSDPIHEFLYYCYKGYSKTEDSSAPGKSSKAKSAGMHYELVSPHQEIKIEKAEAEEQVSAVVQLSKLIGDEDRMRAIAEIMTLQGYNEETSADGVFLLIKQHAVENNEEISRYGKTARKRFMEVAALPSENLDSARNIMIAKNLGVLRIFKDHVKLNGREIKGVFNETKLISYFQDVQNQKDYSEVLDTLDTFRNDGRIKKTGI